MPPVRRVAVVAAIVIACALFANPYIRGDGNGYYAYVRSVVIDHDLKFQNEFRRADPAFLRSTTTDGTHFRESMDAKPGYIRNQWSVGSSLLWTPFFLVAHGFVQATGHWPADGYAFPYRWASAVGTALATALGLYLASRVARRVTDDRAAVTAVVAIIGASSIAIYMWFLPFWGLAPATLPAAALLVLFHRGRSWAVRRWFVYGALVGLATTTHPLGIAWLALLAVAWLFDHGTAAQRAIAGLVSAAGFVVAELPQMIIRYVVHGNPLHLGYSEQWDFLRPPILAQFFSAQHGLFTWTPVTLVALAGLVLLLRTEQHRRLALGLLTAFAVLTYLAAADVTPEQSSFGNRMFVHFTPGFVVGGAAAVAYVRRRVRSPHVVAVGVAALIAWNMLFAFQWAWGLLPKRGPVDWSDMARQQFTTAPREIGSVAVRFFTDRDDLIREVQQRDEERVLRGSGE